MVRTRSHQETSGSPVLKGLEPQTRTRKQPHAKTLAAAASAPPQDAIPEEVPSTAQNTPTEHPPQSPSHSASTQDPSTRLLQQAEPATPLAKIPEQSAVKSKTPESPRTHDNTSFTRSVLRSVSPSLVDVIRNRASPSESSTPPRTDSAEPTTVQGTQEQDDTVAESIGTSTPFAARDTYDHMPGSPTINAESTAIAADISTNTLIVEVETSILREVQAATPPQGRKRARTIEKEDEDADETTEERPAKRSRNLFQQANELAPATPPSAGTDYKQVLQKGPSPRMGTSPRKLVIQKGPSPQKKPTQEDAPEFSFTYSPYNSETSPVNGSVSHEFSNSVISNTTTNIQAFHTEEHVQEVNVQVDMANNIPTPKTNGTLAKSQKDGQSLALVKESGQASANEQTLYSQTGEPASTALVEFKKPVARQPKPIVKAFLTRPSTRPGGRPIVDEFILSDSEDEEEGVEREVIIRPEADPVKLRALKTKTQAYFRAKKELTEVMGVREDEFAESQQAAQLQIEARKLADRMLKEKAQAEASRPPSMTHKSSTPNSLLFPASATKQELVLTDPETIDKLRAIADWLLRDPAHKLPAETALVTFLDNPQSQGVTEDIQMSDADESDDQYLDEHPEAHEHDDDTYMLENGSEVSPAAELRPSTPLHSAPKNSGWSVVGVVKNLVSSPFKFLGSRKSSNPEASATDAPNTDFVFRHEHKLSQPSTTPLNKSSNRKKNPPATAHPLFPRTRKQPAKKGETKKRRPLQRPSIVSESDIPIQSRGLISEERKLELQREQDEQREKDRKAKESELDGQTPRRGTYAVPSPPSDSDDEDGDNASPLAKRTTSRPDSNNVGGGGLKRNHCDSEDDPDNLKYNRFKKYAPEVSKTVKNFNASGTFSADFASSDDDDDDEGSDDTNYNNLDSSPPQVGPSPTDEPVQQTPPPKPRPSNATLPSLATTTPAQSSQELARPVGQTPFDKHKPKTPSRLRNVVRFSSSPVPSPKSIGYENLENEWSAMSVDTPSPLKDIPTGRPYPMPNFDFPNEFEADPEVLALINSLPEGVALPHLAYMR